MKPCPACGGVLQLIPADMGILILPAQFIRGKSTYIETVQPRLVVACTECDYLKETK